MIKLIKNDFFIYCKEARIENNRSYYGSFSLGPFDAGQSITIANALRRTLLSELKGLAITSVEIEGAFHEYSTLPGVRDSTLDILLNLKDIVLKSINLGNKKKGTSYYATFKNEQVGYLKTRGPGVVTASELKLPPGIQCVDPDQYIATLSEEGILNIKFYINEGKNYGIQTYKANPPSDSITLPEQSVNYHKGANFPRSDKKYIKANSVFSDVPAPSIALPTHSVGYHRVIYQASYGDRGPQSGLIPERGYATLTKRRLWLKKLKLIYLPTTTAGLLGKSGKKEASKRNKVLAKGPRSQKKAFLPAIDGQRSFDAPHFSYKLTRFLHSGRAIAASKAVPLAIDAVFMPVNKVNYIIEMNEQSVMSKDKDKGSINLQREYANVSPTEWGISLDRRKKRLEGLAPSKVKERWQKGLVNNSQFDPRSSSLRKSGRQLVQTFITPLSPRYTNRCFFSLRSVGVAPALLTIAKKKREHAWLNGRITPLIFPISKRVAHRAATLFSSTPSCDASQMGSSASLCGTKERLKGEQNAPAYFFSDAKKTQLGLFKTNSYLCRNKEPRGTTEKKQNDWRLSDTRITTSLQNNIIIEIWTNGSIHPRQALYEACKNLLSLFSKLEKATPLQSNLL